MTTPGTNTDTCGTVRASLLYRAPIFSESGACVLVKEHAGDHRGSRGGAWNLIPLYPATNTVGETVE